MVLPGRRQCENIKFGTSALSPTMAGVWMAKESGAFERHGINAELVYISSGAMVVQALVGGSVHAALGASNAVIAAILKGAPIIAVGSNTSRPGMQLWVHPDIQRPEQLAGKTLGITRFGSTSDFVTRLVLRKLNLEGKTELRQFGGVVEADIGFRSGQSEGRLSSQSPGPDARNAGRRRGAGHSLFDESAGREQRLSIAKSPKSVEGIVAAYIEGIAALKTAKAASAQAVLAKYMGQRGGSADMHYEFVMKYLEAVPRVDPAAIDTVLEMVGSKDAAKTKLYDNSIVDRLVQEGLIDDSTKERSHDRKTVARVFGRAGARLYALAGAGILFFHQDEQAQGRGHGEAAESVCAPPARLLGACVGQLPGDGRSSNAFWSMSTKRLSATIFPIMAICT